MGMYTAVHFASELKKDVPQEVVDVLNYLADGSIGSPEKLPDHEFFQCERWRNLFHCDSYYFDYSTESNFGFDDISGSYYLSFTSNLKDYDNEIDKFIDWIKPYLNKSEGEFLGYKRYEENREPTLIYY